MAGKRQKETDLPPRVYESRGTYYYASRITGKWTSLGKDKKEAIRYGRSLYEGKARDPTVPRTRPDLPAAKYSDLKELGSLMRQVSDMLDAAKSGAKARGLAFELTVQDILDMYVAADGKCSATGIAFSNERPPGARIALWKPSLDRIDSSRGYTADNVRIVCAVFNVAIQDHGDDVFEKLAIGFLGTRKTQPSSAC